MSFFSTTKVHTTDEEKTIKQKKRCKKRIPQAFREQIWLRDFSRSFQGKCPTSWCQNIISVFDFQAGHNIPESKGGPTVPDNLLPLCSRCNSSMGDRYTFDEWNAVSSKVRASVLEVDVVDSTISGRFCGCF